MNAVRVSVEREDEIAGPRRLIRSGMAIDAAHLVAGLVAVVVGLLAVVVLVGWMLDIAPLKSVLPGLATMKASTALCLLLVSGGLALTIGGGGSAVARTARVALPLLASGIGALSLIQYAVGVDLGIDQLLFTDDDPLSAPYPGRMSVLSAGEVTALGAALLLVRRRSRPAEILFSALCLVGFAGAMLALVGYAYGVWVLYHPAPHLSTPLHSAAAFVALNVGVLSLRPDLGLVALLRAKGAGGAVMRRLLPAVVLLLPLLGWLILRVELETLDDLPSAVAVFALVSVTVLLAIVWPTAQQIERLDMEQRRMAAALRATEARFLAFVQNVPFICYLTDRDGRYLFHNSEAEQVIGQSDAELRGKTAWHVNPPEVAAEIAAMDRQGLIAGQPLVTERHAPNGGGYEWSMAIKFPIRDDEGEITGIGGFDIDIGHRKQAEKALSESAAMLQRAQKMESVGQLTAGIAHDFNNMLTVVLGTLELVEERADPALRPPVGSALQAVEHAAELVRRLLAFSRRQPLNPSDLDINALVRDVEPLLRRALGEDVEIELELAADLGVSRADGAQVESALMNLAVNARDAMAEGGKLTIETSNQTLDEDYARANMEVAPGDYVMLAVSDTGTGMPPDVVARVIESFFTTKEFGKGSGLGLSMVYGFAKQSGGHLKIYSEPGHGTQVRLYLPRVDGDAVEARPDRAGIGRDLRGSETILLVEDNLPVRDFVAAQLRDLGYHVIEAANGPSAQAVLAGDVGIDLLFTDVIMPGGMTGRQLSEAARRSRPGLKTLFTSGYTENSIVHQGKLDPGINFLPKPHKRHELAAKVRAVLDQEG